MNVKQPPRQREGAYQRLMPISNSCPSWTSHFLTALTVKFTSRLNATKEYGGWRVNDSSVMRKERHSFHLPPFSEEKEISTIWWHFPSLLHLHCAAVMELIPADLVKAKELIWQIKRTKNTETCHTIYTRGGGGVTWTEIDKLKALASTMADQMSLNIVISHHLFRTSLN